VGDELIYQSKMRPILDEAISKIERSIAARKCLGPPPYYVHAGGRHSVRPIFRKLRDPMKGGQLDEVAFWVEGKTTMGRVTAIGENRHLKYVALQVDGARHPIVVFSEAETGANDTLFGYLASLLIKRKT
jgi:hypothetical protein